MSIASTMRKMPNRKAMRQFRQDVNLAWMSLHAETVNEKAKEGERLQGFQNPDLYVESKEVGLMRINLAAGRRDPISEITNEVLISAVTDILSDVLKSMRLKVTIDSHNRMSFRHI